MGTNTLNWINAVKGICIILVFYSHCSIFYNIEIPYAREFIEAFYVNGFFFVSGYLLYRKQLSFPVINKKVIDFIKFDLRLGLKNIFFRIILPSIFFSIFFYIPKKILKGGSVDIISMCVETIGGGTYWFTTALVFAQILIYLMLITRCKSILFYLISSIVLSILGLRLYSFFYESVYVKWFSIPGFIALTYMALGGIYYCYEKLIDKFLNSWFHYLLFAIYLVLVSTIYTKLHFTTSMCTMNFPGVVVAFIGILLLIRFCKIIPNLIALSYIGKNSLLFYFLSGGIPYILSSCVKALKPNSILMLLLIWILSLSLSYIVTYLINRKCSFLLDLRLNKKTIKTYY